MSRRLHKSTVDLDPALSDSEQSDVLAVLSRTSTTPVFWLETLFSVLFSVFRGELREESELSWLEMVARVSSLWVGALAVSRSAELMTSQVNVALQSSGLGLFAL